jgi:uncharacterized protein (TIGR03492 family)
MNRLSEFASTSNSKPPTSKFRLLCLSNGHGEDIIAVRILQELQQHSPNIDVAALPIVGEGRAYTQLGISLIGSVQTMPSGGFIYMDGRQLVRDVRGGLLQLTLSQIKAVRSWARFQAQPGKEGGAILAVGDIVPLLFAWLSGATYAFVGTAKSEYYLRDEVGFHQRHSLFNRFEGWSGSVYHPWERWLMSRPRCKAVFPRDSLTTKNLQKWSIPAFNLGNPMMDQLDAVTSQMFYSADAERQEQARSLTITLLPGSRPPEAYANWQQIIVAVAALCDTFSARSLLFLGAIASSLSLEPLCQILVNADFQQVSNESPLPDPKALTFKHKNGYLILSQHAYNDCLQHADMAIAMAGTATEQFVGLGKPAIAFPGKGPQFTYAFAEAQARLLGSSLILVDQPTQVAEAVQSLLCDPDRLQLIAENGLRRMGKPGAARRIAACLMERLSQS